MSNKIIKLHGCSGAGKTTAVRSLMLAANSVTEVIPHDSKNGRPEAYACQFAGWDEPICVLGSYKNNCGGMDSYSSNAQDIIKLIESYREIGHVLFEGLLLSTYYGGVGKHLEQYGDDVILAFMNTPSLVCLERVTHRRDVQQTKGKFDPAKTIEKYNTIVNLKRKCELNGRRVVEIAYDKDPVAQFQILFRDAV